jgi:hypothetical protein
MRIAYPSALGALAWAMLFRYPEGTLDVLLGIIVVSNDRKEIIDHFYKFVNTLPCIFTFDCVCDFDRQITAHPLLFSLERKISARTWIMEALACELDGLGSVSGYDMPMDMGGRGRGGIRVIPKGIILQT